MPLPVMNVLERAPQGAIDICVTSVWHVDLRARTNYGAASRSSEVTLELDSHADTCCVGMNALIIHDYDRPVSVYGYDRTLDPDISDSFVGHNVP